MVVKELTSKTDFDHAIQADKLVVIDFYATWCGPCRMISPYLEELSSDATLNEKGVLFYKVDVDKLADVAQEVGITAMPTFICYRKGKKVEELVGASKDRLKHMIEKNA
ncbi:thioredoxin 1 [Galdieria sulphuraria]|uniref:Thioredoxin n=1 Tax=Galdieria sulphuraria TaxID=130081 RepID=M2Y6C1_GALSU|nr:thioredoxin 1 [Galdieria sulphuraria]EME31394.1 thioredoxin 1 [Galdieria sulphuraria]|eukprot:XP_005707914.1 thioredoxin 1 [Galdieria sulphuraria]